MAIATEPASPHGALGSISSLETGDPTLYALLRLQASRVPDAIAITDGSRAPLSYRSLVSQVDHATRTLNSIGLSRNDRVAVVLPNGPEMAVALLAIAGGFSCAPLNPAYRESEFDFYLTHLNAAALVVQSGVPTAANAAAQKLGIPIVKLRPASEGAAGTFTLIGESRAPRKPGGLTASADAALLLHTSGTTSKPKLVPLTQANLCASACNIATSLELSERDCCFDVMPLFHIHGLMVLLASLASGGKVVCPYGADSIRLLGRMEEVQPSWYSASPAVHQVLLREVRGKRNVGTYRLLRFIRSASSFLPATLLTELQEVWGAPVIEAYGMTEACHQISSNPVHFHKRKLGSVGIATGTEVAIMDAAGNLLPPAHSGEIVIRGANVMKGYVDNPEANARSFRHGWLRTGDQGYRDEEGYVFINGRLKEIINRGGEKISPREVDEVILQHPAVAQAATFAMPHPGLGEEVAAAIVLREFPAATESEIREFAQRRLAHFKVPQKILILDEIPKGPTGKVQRTSLAAQLGLTASHFTAPDPENSAYTVPRTATEFELARIWSEVLGVDRVGIHDSFFDLGGHSLNATQVMSRVSSRFHVELPVSRLFDMPTVASLAHSIDAASCGEHGRPTAAMLPVPRAQDVPLSFAQERLWFLDQLEPGNTFNNVPVAFRLTGRVQMTIIERSLNEIVRRHEILRTRFTAVEGKPVQRIVPAFTLTVRLIDLRYLPLPDRDVEMRRLFIQETQRPFVLAEGPLVRATVLRLSPNEHILLVMMHHIITDGWSTEIFLREFAALYNAFASGKRSPLADIPIQYADFAVWQRQWLKGDLLDSQLAYWKKQLGPNLSPIDLPTDRPRLTVQSHRGARQSLMLPGALAEALTTLSRREGATLFMTLLSVFKILLYRYTGQKDIVVGSPIAGRARLETEELIGFFVNTLVLRTDLWGQPTFRELLGRVREVTLQAYAHQTLPFEKLVEELRPDRNLSHSPLFQVMFAFQNIPRADARAEGLVVSPMEVDGGTARFDLSFLIAEEAKQLKVSAEYNTDLFGAAFMCRMLGHFHTLLESVVANPDQLISELPLLKPTERRQLVMDWNNNQRDYPRDKCIHHLFEAQVERTPDSVAAIFENQQLTYRELNGRANQVAHRLRALGVGPDTVVGICLERSLDMVVGLLGILKAGGAYLPLDPAYPRERLAFMLEDAQVPILLTLKRFFERLPEHGARMTICLDDCEVLARESEVNPNSEVTGEHLAYLIYTSGSTGTPKGVLITHQNVVHSTCARMTFYREPVRRFLLLSPLAFDSSVAGIFWTLCQGGKLILPQENLQREPRELLDLIAVHQISHLLSLPSLYTLLLTAAEAAPKNLGSLDTVIVAGERCPRALVEHHHRLLSKASLFNEYGPTEGTVWSAVYPCRLEGLGAQVPIGRPIANTQIYLLDSQLQPVPAGIPGELHIAGDGLARGYLNRPELMAEKFIPHPLSEDPNMRLYKTGDLARYRPDGNLEFLGRIDHQVKIRGFRVELGEIEATLSQYRGVKQAVVVDRDDAMGEKRLVAYIVPREKEAPASSVLRSFLKSRLPEFMMPAAFVVIDALPLTPNGKVDRHSFPLSEQLRPELEMAPVAPRDPVEQRLIEIWQNLLGSQSIGVTDNFFDVGGHSLLAVRLVSQIEKTFGSSVRVADLFGAPTVELLANLLRQRKTTDVSSSLVPVQPHGTKPPVFWVHGDSTGVYLSRHLGLDQPFYGLEHQSRDGTRAHYTELEAIAAHYLEEVRRVQSVGPYFLGGYSFGGTVAFEMARKLKAQQEQVALLVLVDSPFPGKKTRARAGESTHLFLMVNAIRRHLHSLGHLRPRKMFADFMTRANNAVKWEAEYRVTELSKIVKLGLCRIYFIFERPLPPALRSPYILNLYHHALENYYPQPYPGQAIYFKSEESSSGYHLNWQRVMTERLDIYEVPGDHLDFMEQSHVMRWVEQFKVCLNKAQETTARNLSLPSIANETSDPGGAPVQVSRNASPARVQSISTVLS